MGEQVDPAALPGSATHDVDVTAAVEHALAAEARAGGRGR